VPRPGALAFPAMLAGSIALAFGGWLVREADVGPVDSAFWRLSLAVLPLMLIARLVRQPIPPMSRTLLVPAALAGLFFAIDLALWHLGLVRTTLANATLIPNAASFLLPLYGFAITRTRPTSRMWSAMALAAAGTILLLGTSFELSAQHFTGDLLCIGAALFYTGYLIVIDRMRGSIAAMPTLILASFFGAIALYFMARASPGAFWPTDWRPVIALAFTSQVLGQGLIVYAVGHLKPLVVGLTLLVQPAIAAAIGVIRFGEVPGPTVIFGAIMVLAALVLVRLPERRRSIRP